jgi:hypothetical protein
VIVGSGISRGLDIFELEPSGFITQNELAAAKSVHVDYLNVQGQPKFTWPATYSLARAYLDQLERSNGMDAAKIADARAELAKAEQASGGKQAAGLTQLVSRLEADAARSTDAAKVQMLANTVNDLASSQSLATAGK